MIRNVQVQGDPDTHPERTIHDIGELASGAIDISKLKVASHSIRIFDLMDTCQRSEYEKLYVELSEKAKQGRIFISSNVREIMTRSDGSTGWFKLIEWTEFDTSDILGA